MSNKILTIGVVVAMVLAIAGIFFPQQVKEAAYGTAATVCSGLGSTTCFTGINLSDGLTITGTGGILETNSGTVNSLAGTTVMNNVLFGVGVSSASTAITISTAATTSVSLTAAQFCNLTSILIPVGNTTTVTVTFPAQAATSLACGSIPVGAWANSWIDNESSFAVTLATSTGSNMNFFFATGTPATSITFPPKIQASTTATFIPFGQTSATTSVLINQFSRAPGF